MNGFGPPVTLRAWWTGDAPEVGQFLQSAHRPRYGYEIVGVKLRKGPLGGRTFTLTCVRWRPTDVPEGATVWPWRWEKR